MKKKLLLATFVLMHVAQARAGFLYLGGDTGLQPPAAALAGGAEAKTPPPAPVATAASPVMPGAAGVPPVASAAPMPVATAMPPATAATAAEGLAGAVGSRVVLRLRPGVGRVSAALRDFAKTNGWVLAWELDRDFPIDYPATFSGSFLDVIEQVARSLQNTDSPVRVKVYEANKVIRVLQAAR
ncbi:toxin co-regulated pilus biosynthesis Q family protein [Chromobacterium vaccinii]|uniref:toxin co-regulated pilus biosynthesis Q family protein n=1 Tax=Chromobacterium vaccinii TaxID=1108595 RepID=UPI0006984E1D|nr:toxin co-regulated pilus biosynthesis Q family protein [Chromobacterium vaccinii]